MNCSTGYKAHRNAFCTSSRGRHNVRSSNHHTPGLHLRGCLGGTALAPRSCTAGAHEIAGQWRNVPRLGRHNPANCCHHCCCCPSPEVSDLLVSLQQHVITAGQGVHVGAPLIERSWAAHGLVNTCRPAAQHSSAQQRPAVPAGPSPRFSKSQDTQRSSGSPLA